MIPTETYTVEDTAQGIACCAYEDLVRLGLSDLDAAAEMIRAAIAMLPADVCPACFLRSIVEGEDADAEAVH